LHYLAISPNDSYAQLLGYRQDFEAKYANFVITMTPKKTPSKDIGEQLSRFKDLAKELEADESPHALDRAFARLDTKKKIESRQPAKRKTKRK
jgi:hypothetical protein